MLKKTNNDIMIIDCVNRKTSQYHANIFYIFEKKKSTIIWHTTNIHNIYHKPITFSPGNQVHDHLNRKLQ